MVYNLDTTLYYRPIFEDRLSINDSLWKTYVLKPGGIASVYYYFNDTAKVPRWQQPAAFDKVLLTYAFNYYITEAKTSKNEYFFSHWVLGYAVGSSPGQEFGIYD